METKHDLLMHTVPDGQSDANSSRQSGVTISCDVLAKAL